jgi:biotin transport system substrate-specific component
LNGHVYLNRYSALRATAYSKLTALSNVHKLVLAAGFALLTALAAQARIMTPFTPVPFTLQVFPVLLAGAVLGATYGLTSQLMYIGMGAVGLPVFSNWSGGHQVILGYTGGYIIGFAVAAFAVGWLIHLQKNPRSNLKVMLAMAAGSCIIWLCGAIGLALVLGVGMEKAFVLGVLPFIGVDLLKMFAAAGIARAALPGPAP